MLKFILARLKIAAAGVGIAVGTAVVEAVDAELVKSFGIGIPAPAKLSAIAAITGFFINFTDNVKLADNGTAVVAPSLPQA